MERNESTTIGRLQFGDRFYKANDKKKKAVWEYVGYKNKRYECKRDTDLHPTPFKADTEVVYLRNN